MSEALPLPSRPSLEQYKKLAKDLQHACESGSPTAIREWASAWLDTLARLYGPMDWPLAKPREVKSRHVENSWNRLKDNRESVSRCTLAGAQFFIARQHGFASWRAFSEHVKEISRANSSVSDFETAADMVVNGELEPLRALLSARPNLIRERSTREHGSTLLHYVSANGIEEFRQKTPANIVDITKLLLAAGAEVDAESTAYGGGATTLGLAATSAHPVNAGVQIELLKTLIDHGARLDNESAGNNHLLVLGCLANGQPEAARFLAGRGAPLDVESSAGLNRVTDLRTHVAEASPKQLESAFLYACGYGALEAAQFLLDRGVSPDARDDEDQTALHWAAWTPHNAIIRLLLERGASVHSRERRFQATPLDTTLRTWAEADTPENRDRCYEAIELLVRAGAKLDPAQWQNPGWAAPAMRERIESDAKLQSVLRGEVI